MFNRRILRIFAFQYLYSQKMNNELKSSKDKKEIILNLDLNRDLFVKTNIEILNILSFWYLKCKIAQDVRDSFVSKYSDVSNKNILENFYLKNIYYYMSRYGDGEKNKTITSKNLEKYANLVFNNKIKHNPKFISYLQNNKPTSIDHLKIILYFLDTIYKSDLIEEYIDNINYNFGLIKPISANLFKQIIKKIDQANPEIPEKIIKKDFSYVEENDFFHKLVSGVIDHLSEISTMATNKIFNWREDRLEIIDKLLIFLGICEILYLNIPKNIVINEYVEISKIYGTPQSKKFINGILDQINDK